jgi:N6-adenosine-specific RNA methylase IME4
MTENSLAKLDKATQMLAEAKTLDEVKHIIDIAEAARTYARAAKLGLEAYNHAAEVKVRAERKAGELLAQLERGKGGGDSTVDNMSRVVSEYKSVLDEQEIGYKAAERWKRIAEMPEAVFEAHLEEERGERPITTSAVLRELQFADRAAARANATVTMPEGRYRTIVIDPPWPIEKIERDVRPNQVEVDYPTMTIEEIAAFPLGDIAVEDGCHVYLWTTHKWLPVAFNVFDAWGVKYQCLLTWVKNVGFTPFSWMYSTEHCLFGRIGSLPLLVNGKRLDFHAAVREHSRKPDEFYKLVSEVSPEPRIDVFSREPREGFGQYGNEVNRFQ